MNKDNRSWYCHTNTRLRGCHESCDLTGAGSLVEAPDPRQAALHFVQNLWQAHGPFFPSKDRVDVVAKDLSVDPPKEHEVIVRLALRAEIYTIGSDGKKQIAL